MLWSSTNNNFCCWVIDTIIAVLKIHHLFLSIWLMFLKQASKTSNLLYLKKKKKNLKCWILNFGNKTRTTEGRLFQHGISTGHHFSGELQLVLSATDSEGWDKRFPIFFKPRWTIFIKFQALPPAQTLSFHAYLLSISSYRVSTKLPIRAHRLKYLWPKAKKLDGLVNPTSLISCKWLN